MTPGQARGIEGGGGGGDQDHQPVRRSARQTVHRIAPGVEKDAGRLYVHAAGWQRAAVGALMQLGEGPVILRLDAYAV